MLFEASDLGVEVTSVDEGAVNEAMLFTVFSFKNAQNVGTTVVSGCVFLFIFYHFL